MRYFNGTVGFNVVLPLIVFIADARPNSARPKSARMAIFTSCTIKWTLLQL